MNFEAVISSPWLIVLGQGIFVFAMVIIVMLDIEKGLEKALKIMTSLLLASSIVVATRFLTLDGALEGVKFILQPGALEITADGILFVLGQSFFTLPLGTTGMITYASYASKGMAIKSSAISIVVVNIFVSVLADLAIFPTLHSLGCELQEGSGLLFKVLPMVFSQVYLGTLLYLGFLVLLLFAALAPSTSLLGLNVSNFMKNDNAKRKKVAVTGSILIFIISIPTTLSFGILKDIRLGAGTTFDNMGFIVSNVLMPLDILGITLVVGQLLDKKLLQQYFGKDRFRLFSSWYYLIKYVMPIAIILVSIVQLFS